MALGGLWHGAGLQFLLWGAAHGGFLAFEHSMRATFPSLAKAIPQAVKVGLTVFIVMLLWLPFRAADLDHTSALLAGLFTWAPLSTPTLAHFFAPLSLMSTAPSAPAVVLLWALMVLAVAACRPTAWRWALSASSWQRGIVAGGMLALVLKTSPTDPISRFCTFSSDGYG